MYGSVHGGIIAAGAAAVNALSDGAAGAPQDAELGAVRVVELDGAARLGQRAAQFEGFVVWQQGATEHGGGVGALTLDDHT